MEWQNKQFKSWNKVSRTRKVVCQTGLPSCCSWIAKHCTAQQVFHRRNCSDSKSHLDLLKPDISHRVEAKRQLMIHTLMLDYSVCERKCTFKTFSNHDMTVVDSRYNCKSQWPSLIPSRTWKWSDHSQTSRPCMKENGSKWRADCTKPGCLAEENRTFEHLLWTNYSIKLIEVSQHLSLRLLWKGDYKPSFVSAVMILGEALNNHFFFNGEICVVCQILLNFSVSHQ